MSRRLALLVNPAANGGRSLRAARAAADELRGLGARFEIFESSSSDHAKAAAIGAAEAGDTVVAVGGDGLVGTLAGALRDRPAALAIVPAGRGNDFARVLGLPTRPAAAARLALEGEERVVDIGEVDGASFVGIASVGLDSIVNRIANETTVVRGGLVYPYATLRGLATWRHAGFAVSVDGGEPERLTGYSVAVANSGVYGGGMRLVPHARLDDGRLDVLMIAAHPRLRLLARAPKVFRGTHLGVPFARVREGEQIEISADRPFTVYADGDPIAELPATVRVVPQCLRVVVPRLSTPGAVGRSGGRPARLFSGRPA